MNAGALEPGCIGSSKTPPVHINSQPAACWLEMACQYVVVPHHHTLADRLKYQIIRTGTLDQSVRLMPTAPAINGDAESFKPMNSLNDVCAHREYRVARFCLWFRPFTTAVFFIDHQSILHNVPEWRTMSHWEHSAAGIHWTVKDGKAPVTSHVPS